MTYKDTGWKNPFSVFDVSISESNKKLEYFYSNVYERRRIYVIINKSSEAKSVENYSRTERQRDMQK